jgi:hypothetical protein
MISEDEIRWWKGTTHQLSQEADGWKATATNTFAVAISIQLREMESDFWNSDNGSIWKKEDLTIERAAREVKNSYLTIYPRNMVIRQNL